jgi:cell migration-inducing and hyaluronan-binding protein
VRSGTEIQVVTERPEVSLSVSEMDKDSWLMFELPGFASAAGPELDSMGALRNASATSWYKDGDTLWVKLVVPADPEMPIRPTVMQESITVSR